MTPNYHIGENYRYPGSKQIFKLKEVKGFTYRFECGHWCTDNIFKQLIRVKTGQKVKDDVQLQLF